MTKSKAKSDEKAEDKQAAAEAAEVKEDAAEVKAAAKDKELQEKPDAETATPDDRMVAEDVETADPADRGKEDPGNEGPQPPEEGPEVAPDALSQGSQPGENADAADRPEPEGNESEAGSTEPGDAGEESAPSTPQNEDVNALAAAAAASIAYGTTNDDNTALPRMDVSWMIGHDGDRAGIVQVSKAAADFLRVYPNVQEETVRIQLKLEKMAQPLETPRALMAWRIFVHAFGELERETAALAQAEAAKTAQSKGRPVISADAAALVPGNRLSR